MRQKACASVAVRKQPLTFCWHGYLLQGRARMTRLPTGLALPGLAQRARLFDRTITRRGLAAVAAKGDIWTRYTPGGSSQPLALVLDPQGTCLYRLLPLMACSPLVDGCALVVFYASEAHGATQCSLERFAYLRQAARPRVAALTQPEGHHSQHYRITEAF